MVRHNELMIMSAECDIESGEVESFDLPVKIMRGWY
jgi:hypothetical protein